MYLVLVSFSREQDQWDEYIYTHKRIKWVYVRNRNNSLSQIQDDKNLLMVGPRAWVPKHLSQAHSPPPKKKDLEGSWWTAGP